MARSSVEGKIYTALMVKKLHEANRFATILDVGAGDGGYSDLLSPHLPGATWIGVEIWPPYIEKFKLSPKYHRLINADIRKLDPATLPPLDLTIFGDVLEHMTKAEALTLVERYLARSRFVLISIPVVPYPQDCENDNPFEVHVKDDWSHQEVVTSFPDIHTAFVHFKTGVYFLTRDPEGQRQLRILQGTVPEVVQRSLPNDAMGWL